MTDYEHFGDYRPTERSSAGIAFTFLFIGLGAGALTALLLTPKSGKQMRKTLRRSYEDARETLEDLSEQAGEIVERGGEWARTAKKKIAPIADRIRG